MIAAGLSSTLTLLVASVALLPVLLRHLPEPEPAAGEPAPGWAGLAGWTTSGQHLVIATIATVAVLGLVPPPQWPLWWPWLCSGLAAALLDAHTTWIPRQLCWVGWGLVPVSVLAALVLGTAPATLVAGLVGALAGTALLWLAWRLGRGQLGFGDVRIMPVVGLAAGSLGLAGFWWSLLLGTGLGAVAALLRRARHRPEAMAYAPALVCGPLLALVLLRLTG